MGERGGGEAPSLSVPVQRARRMLLHSSFGRLSSSSSFPYLLPQIPILSAGQGEDVAHLGLLMDVGSLRVPQLTATGALPHRRSRGMASGELLAVCFPGLWVRKENRQEKEMGNCLFLSKTRCILRQSLQMPS